MKLLMLGIDGGDKRIIDAMPMPFLQELLANTWHKPVQEDLFARGWAKILCGQSGSQTGAFYAKPEQLPRGCGATASWKSTDYERGGAVPLWQALNDEGLSVGFMNVPTTYPAPKVNGFFVAGAGGGIGDGVMPPNTVYPDSVADVLRSHDYIFDTRFKASGIRDRASFLARLTSMTEKRISAYLELQTVHHADVGFVAFMGPTRLQYLAMKEIERMISCVASNESYPDDLKDIGYFYAQFDDQLRRLVEGVEPDGVLVVSDHGQAPHRFDVDVGALLAKNELLCYRPAAVATLQVRARHAIKAVLPSSLGGKLAKKRSLRKLSGAQSNIDFSTSFAFGLRNVPGVYLNDERFAGVVGREQRPAILEQIVKAINQSEEALQHNIHAYQRHSESSTDPDVEPLLPDVWLDLPEGYLVDYGVGNSEGKLVDLVGRNVAYTMPLDLSTVTRDQWTGMKGRSALLAGSAGCPELPDNIDNGDLTAAYYLAIKLALKS